MKKFITLLLTLIMVFLLTACGAKVPVEEPTEPVEPAEPTESVELAKPSEPVEPLEPETALVGISMPTKDIPRWLQDGIDMQALLKEAGYNVDLKFAANDAAQQANQIQDMIANGAKVLIISVIDSDALSTVLSEAKEAGIAVISYDRLIMGSDAVSYYCTFDLFEVGRLQGQYIVDTLDLEHADGKTYNIELFADDPGDHSSPPFFDGAMEILSLYIDNGTLIIPSGEDNPAYCIIADFDSDRACERMKFILDEYYSDGKLLDAVYCANDSLAQGVVDALQTGYHGESYPIITGQDCDIPSVKNMLDGLQTMSVFKDTHDLAVKAVEMCKAVLEGTEPEINNTDYDNGTGTIPAYLCAPKICTAENYEEILIDSGY